MSGLTLADRYRGRFWVVYPDGLKSMGMTYSVACTYRTLFGGRVTCRLWEKWFERIANLLERLS